MKNLKILHLTCNLKFSLENFPEIKMKMSEFCGKLLAHSRNKRNKADKFINYSIVYYLLPAE